jgi:hypothetical protein
LSAGGGSYRLATRTGKHPAETNPAAAQLLPLAPLYLRCCNCRGDLFRCSSRRAKVQSTLPSATLCSNLLRPTLLLALPQHPYCLLLPLLWLSQTRPSPSSYS